MSSSARRPSESPDVIVVGAGAIGLCCAWHLLRRGADVLLIDRGPPGGATTTTTGGGVRLQFDSLENIRLSQLSFPFWESFAAEFGIDPLIQRSGYLFVAQQPASAARLAADVRLQRAAGVASEWLDGDTLRARWPRARLDTYCGGAFAAGDFHLDHHRVVEGLVRGIEAGGGRILSGHAARTLVRRGDRVVGVSTAESTFAAGTVINAAGPWAAALARTAGLHFPITARRLNLMRLSLEFAIPSGTPWVFDVDAGLHIRADGTGHALAGGLLREAPVVEPDAHTLDTDPEWQRRVITGLATVLPWFDADGVNVARAWAGLYAGPPDARPIIERSLPGLVTVAGFSGSGLMHAPAAGRLAAELIIDGTARSLDIGGFSAQRFECIEAEWRARF